MSQYLRIEKERAVKLTGADGQTAILPGIVRGIEVVGELQVETKKLEDHSNAAKIIRGFNDAKIRILVTLLPPDVERQIKQIDTSFKVGSLGELGKAREYRVVNPHLDARGITTLLFRRFTTSEADEDDAVECTLEFQEYASAYAAIEAKLQTAATSGPQAGIGTDGKPATSTDTPQTTNADGTPKTPPGLQGFADGSSAANKLLGGE